jgi:hypothetical protein
MNKAWVVERKDRGKWLPLELEWIRKDARARCKYLRGFAPINEYRIRRWVREGEK